MASDDDSQRPGKRDDEALRAALTRRLGMSPPEPCPDRAELIEQLTSGPTLDLELKEDRDDRRPNRIAEALEGRGNSGNNGPER